MDRDTFIEKLNELLAEEFEVDVQTIHPDSTIKITLALDSLSFVDLIAVIENEFGVKIPGQELKELKVFSQLYDYIYDKIEQK
ncbi:MAG: acyl carrier protein [Paludibacteraceae bacterium]|jgi:Acyl carrier protein|nr:acyl carrier protein [Paludibacteraceae bacterium]